MIKVIPIIQDPKEVALYANTFILSDNNNNCIVIDPSRDDQSILNIIKNNNFTLKGILLTHTHFDHMNGINTILNEFNVPLYCYISDIPGLNDPKKNLSGARHPLIINKSATPIVDNEILNIIDEPIKVIHTPYHTIGSCCFYIEQNKILFTGDSLFSMYLGRSDFITSCPYETKNSLKKIMSLPNDVTIYPGHGRFTSIGFERANNPFINRN